MEKRMNDFWVMNDMKFLGGGFMWRSKNPKEGVLWHGGHGWLASYYGH